MSAIQKDETWQVRAACRGPQSDLFFPPNHFEKKADREARERAAKEICATCPVTQACLEYSIRIREPHGVWGGLSELDRKQLMAEAG